MVQYNYQGFLRCVYRLAVALCSDISIRRFGFDAEPALAFDVLVCQLLFLFFESFLTMSISMTDWRPTSTAFISLKSQHRRYISTAAALKQLGARVATMVLSTLHRLRRSAIKLRGRVWVWVMRWDFSSSHLQGQTKLANGLGTRAPTEYDVQGWTNEFFYFWELQ